MVCAPSQRGRHPRLPSPGIPPLAGPIDGALQVLFAGGHPSTLPQLDHGCHLSVRQPMSLHLVSKFKLHAGCRHRSVRGTDDS